MSLTRWRDTGQAFSYQGHRIFSRTHGDGDEALLLLHGFPTSSWDFEAMWPGLCQRFGHVIAFDLLGLGFSDKPHPHAYSVFEQADIAVQLLATRGVRHVHLLAHNYGVCVAQELLARERERASGDLAVRSAVLLNGGPFPEAHRPRPMQRLLQSPLGVLLMRFGTQRRFQKEFSRMFGPQTQPSMIELHDYWSLLCLNEGLAVSQSLLRYVHERQFQRLRWGGALTASSAPMRLIYGALDGASGQVMAARYRERMPNADIVALDNIGHFPHIEAPDRTLRAFLAFHDSIKR